jgi:peptide/nickel transport system substrate-binding protein
MRLIALLLAALLAAPAAQAQKSADTLRVTWRDAVPTMDPYYSPLRAALVLAHQTSDTLVYRDPETFALKPLLATAWRYIDDTTLEFDLRQDATFHNGDKFSADDVVYTLNRILSDKQVSVPSNYIWLAGAEKIDTYKVRVKLKRVFPAALEYIAMVLPIWPQAYRERIGIDAYAKAPIGAGPYRFTRIDGTTQIELERYDGYYAASPKGRPAIRRVVIHEVTDANTELAELLAGRTDWIWNFVADNFNNIAAVPTLQAVRAESMRIGYLSMDVSNRAGLPDNPFAKRDVREAVFRAIDRQAIARQLVQGGARVPNTPCYPEQFGCDAAAAIDYPYDPGRAKALLAQAGYPNGFDTEIVSYVLPQYNGAIQNYLAAVGIRAKMTVLQVASAVSRSMEGKDPIDLGNFGSYSINDVSAIMPYFFNGGANDYVRDPALSKLVEQGGNSIDPAARRAFYSQAIHLVSEQAYWLPLHTYVTTYGFSRQLDFKPYADEVPRYFLSKWK